MLPYLAGKPLDDKHLLPEVSTLFMAGFESESSRTLRHGMFLGYQAPDVILPGQAVLQHAAQGTIANREFAGMQEGLHGLVRETKTVPAEALPCCAATGHTAAWVVYAVSQHPQVEAKIVEELRSLDLLATPEQPSPRPIQWEDIPRLTYLNAVIKVRLPLLCICAMSSLPCQCLSVI